LLEESYEMTGATHHESGESLIEFKVFNPKWIKELDSSPKRRVAFRKWFMKEEPYTQSFKMTKIWPNGKSQPAIYKFICSMNFGIG
jgi:hypothetical protein